MWLLVIALIVLYIATFIFISNNVKKRSPRQSGGSVRPATPGAKKVPPARASRPHQSGQAPQQKRPQQKKPAGASGLSKGAKQNPEAGSIGARQALEQRLYELNVGGHNSGGRR